MTLEEYIASVRSKSIAVIGLGISNTPLAELFLQNGCRITIRDSRSADQLGSEYSRLKALGAEFCLGEQYLEDLYEELIFRTPGLMPFDPHLIKAKGQGSILTSEMEVFFSLCPCKMIAVTGSDGKTTTASIIYELLKAAGYRVHLGGNIGHPLLCDLPLFSPDDVAVLELSSFQLHSMKCRPQVAVITNLSPNHLDKHSDFQDYMDAKSNVFLNQKETDRLILNFDDPHTEHFRSQAVTSRISYFSDSSPIPEGCLCENGILKRLKNGLRTTIMSAEEIRIPGEHNVQNYLAAFEAVDGMVSDTVCREVAMHFQGVPHRLEEIRVLNGVTYINDSIASSPTRTIAGLHALKKKPIVICGGYDKHLSFDELGRELCKNAKAVILTGASAWKIAESVFQAEEYTDAFSVTMVSDFEQAVLLASKAAESGDIVLLSPACASFDRFRNFEERGNLFREMIMRLEE